jgi:hypothetical protein
MPSLAAEVGSSHHSPSSVRVSAIYARITSPVPALPLIFPSLATNSYFIPVLWTPAKQVSSDRSAPVPEAYGQANKRMSAKARRSMGENLWQPRDAFLVDRNRQPVQKPVMSWPTLYYLDKFTEAAQA